MVDVPIVKFANRRPDWKPADLNLSDLQLHTFAELEKSAESRQTCPQCQRSRHLYCYDCLVPFTPTPSLQLPFQLSIITHHAEAASKNTGVHAAVLCPQQVQLHSIDALPAVDSSRCVVMFPSDDAVLPDQVDVQQVDRVVIIDSKWRKAKELNAHHALTGMQRVKLPGGPRSCFWRFHTEGVSDEGVCTIEALHLLLRAWAGQLTDEPYQGNPHYFDNLLWYFAFQHQLVTTAAAERQQKKKQQGQQQPKIQQSKKQRQQQQQQQQVQDQGQQQQEHEQQSEPDKQQQQQQQQQEPQQGAASVQQEEEQHSKRPKLAAQSYDNGGQTLQGQKQQAQGQLAATV